jgi:hypothetical protein
MIQKCLAAFVVLGVLASGAPSANAAQTEPKVQAGDVQAIDSAFDNLRAKITDGSVAPSDYDRVNQAIASDPSLAPYRARLEAIITALRNAKKATPDDAKRAYTLANDARLAFAFQTLHAAIEKGRASEADFDRIAKLLVVRAMIAQGMQLDWRANQKRIESAVQDLKKKFLAKTMKPEELDQIEVSTSQVRLDTTVTDLEQRVAGKVATQPDFGYTRQAIADYVAVQMREQGGADHVVRRVNGILDSIEKRALANEAVTPEQWAELRAALTTRALEASAGK